jgi:hypothetical protein
LYAAAAGSAPERQTLDLAKLFLSADQNNLFFIQIFVIIWQFCGTGKNKLSFFP